MKALTPRQRELLKNVVATAWANGPKNFLQSVLHRTGQSFEGEVWFGYSAQFPDELAPGVTLGFFNDELTLGDSEFDVWVFREASARLAASADAPLAALLRQLGERIDP